MQIVIILNKLNYFNFSHIYYLLLFLLLLLLLTNITKKLKNIFITTKINLMIKPIHFVFTNISAQANCYA